MEGTCSHENNEVSRKTITLFNGYFHIVRRYGTHAVNSKPYAQSTSYYKASSAFFVNKQTVCLSDNHL